MNITFEIDPFLGSMQLPLALLSHINKDRQSHSETHMSAISSRLTSIVAAVLVNGMIMAAVGYLFALQSHPHLSAISFAEEVVAHRWFS
jgi:hypothetical protein